MILEVIVLLWLFLQAGSLLICAGYCKYRKRKDAAPVSKSQNGSIGKHEDALQPTTQKRGIMRLLSSLRQKMDPYLYGLSRYMTIRIGRIPSHRVRKILLRRVFQMEIHPEAVIYGGFEIRSPWNIRIGKCVVGVNALLDGRNGIDMENGVCLAQNVMIFTEQHDINDPWFRCLNKGGPVTLKERAWISSRTVILPGVTVGEGAVLASGAVAPRDLNPFVVYAGVPAKPISHRNEALLYDVGAQFWHFY